MASWGGGVGCHFSHSRSNTKNKKKSPMLIPILLHEVIINKCIVVGVFRTPYTIFSQLKEYTSSEVALKSEVRAHHASAYLSMATRPSL